MSNGGNDNDERVMMTMMIGIDPFFTAEGGGVRQWNAPS